MKIFATLLFATLMGCTAQLHTTPAGPPPPRHSQPRHSPPRRPPPPPVEPSRPPPPVATPTPPPPPAPPVAERWLELAPPQRNDDTRDFVLVGKDKGQFRQVRFDVRRGSLVLRQVVVEFGNGKQQKVRFDRTVAAGEPPITIQLDGGQRNIARILIYNDAAQRRRDRGAYRLFAR